jgi:hypothetical protein
MCKRKIKNEEEKKILDNENKGECEMDEKYNFYNE